LSAAGKAGDLAGARRYLVEDTDQTLNLLAEARDDLARAEQAITAGTARALDAQLRTDRRLVLALCLTALAVGTLFAVVVTRSIVRPLGRAEEGARRLAGGEYSSRVLVTTHDEVGRVSAALNTLAEAVGEREARIHKLANTDSMTSLPQRSRFVVEAGELPGCAGWARPARCCASTSTGSRPSTPSWASTPATR